MLYSVYQHPLCIIADGSKIDGGEFKPALKKKLKDSDMIISPDIG
jgi:hypothetical protein